MAESSKHNYALRNKSKSIDVNSDTENDNYMKVDNKVKGYSLNLQKAWKGKAAQTKIEPITHTVKNGNNITIECNTAAYELVKSHFYNILKTEMAKVNNNNKICGDIRKEQLGLEVEQKITVEGKENLTIHFYNTKSSLLINGKGYQFFLNNVLPKIYELVNDNEEIISNNNEKIGEIMNSNKEKISNKAEHPITKKHSDKNNIGEENENQTSQVKAKEDRISVTTKIGEVENEKQQQGQNDNKITAKQIKSSNEPDKELIIDENQIRQGCEEKTTTINNILENQEQIDTSEAMENSEVLDNEEKITESKESKKSIDTIINTNTNVTQIQSNQLKDTQDYVSDKRTNEDVVTMEDDKEIQLVDKNKKLTDKLQGEISEEQKTALNDTQRTNDDLQIVDEVPNITNEIKNVKDNFSKTICHLQEYKSDQEIDFQTNNPQDMEYTENDYKQKGTKRLRAEEDDEDDDISGKDRVDKKERRGAEKEVVQVNETRNEQPMNIDDKIETKINDHDYTNGKETSDAQEKTDQKQCKTDNENEVTKPGTNNQCQKCRKNVVSRATQCGDCKQWVHYNCLKISEEQLHQEWPGEYICKACNQKQQEQNKKEQNKKDQNKNELITLQVTNEAPQNSKKAIDNNTKTKQQTKIIITDEIEPNELRIAELEAEKEKTNNKLKEMMNNCKDYKKELQLKDNQLNDRKIEVARINKTNEDNRKEINMMKLKYETLQKQKEMMEASLQQEKTNWNDNLSKELQSQYEKHEKLKADYEEVRNKMLQQYTQMIAEKDEIISKLKKESEEGRVEISTLKSQLQQAETGSHIIQEKNTIINKLENDCQEMRKYNQNLININGKLEHEIFTIKSTNIGWKEGVKEHGQSNITQTTKQNVPSTRVEMPSLIPIGKQSQYQQITQNDKSMTVTDIPPSTSRSILYENTEIDQYNESSAIKTTNNEMNIRKSSDTNNIQSGKQCYGCGDLNHEIKNCNKKSNLFVKFTGNHWINNYKLDQVFGKFGHITSKRIMRDRNGEYTRSAMVCYQTESEARIAVEEMEDNQQWIVRYFDTSAPQQRQNRSNTNNKVNNWKPIYRTYDKQETSTGRRFNWNNSDQQRQVNNTKYREEQQETYEEEKCDVKREIVNIKNQVQQINQLVVRLLVHQPGTYRQ